MATQLFRDTFKLLLKEKICAKNCFESYVYNTKNTLGGRNSDSNISPEAMKEIEDSIEDSLDLIDDSADAEKEDYIDRQKEVGQIDNPIMIWQSTPLFTRYTHCQRSLLPVELPLGNAFGMPCDHQMI